MFHLHCSAVLTQLQSDTVTFNDDLHSQIESFLFKIIYNVGPTHHLSQVYNVVKHLATMCWPYLESHDT